MVQQHNRGEIWWYNFGSKNEADGSLQFKKRPCVIVSNDKNNYHSSIVLIAPVTTRDASQLRHWQAFYYEKENSKPQIILCEQIQAVNKSKLFDYVGKLDATTMLKVNKALAIQLDLNIAENELNSYAFLERLDILMDKVIKEKFENYNLQLEEIINAVKSLKFDHLFDSKLMNELNSIPKSINAINGNIDITNNNVNLIKEAFNKQQSQLEKILTSLIGLYSDSNKNINELTTKGEEVVNSDNINENAEISHTDEYEPSVNDIIIDEDFISDECILDEDTYGEEIINANMTIETNSMSNENNNTVNEVEVAYKPKRKYTRKNNNSDRQPPINYEDIDGLIAFIEECNTNSTDYICNKYGLTKKQYSNRKYLISKFLKNNNIDCEIVKHKRRKVK